MRKVDVQERQHSLALAVEDHASFIGASSSAGAPMVMNESVVLRQVASMFSNRSAGTGASLVVVRGSCPVILSSGPK